MSSGAKNMFAIYAPGETLPEPDWGEWSFLADCPYGDFCIGHRGHVEGPQVVVARVKGEWWYEIAPSADDLLGSVPVDKMDETDTSKATRFTWDQMPEILTRFRLLHRLGAY